MNALCVESVCVTVCGIITLASPACCPLAHAALSSGVYFGVTCANQAAGAPQAQCSWGSPSTAQLAASSSIPWERLTARDTMTELPHLTARVYFKGAMLALVGHK